MYLAPLAKVVWYINRLLFHADIDFRADLSGGFILVHGLGVVIGSSVVSTGPLTVYQGVTIGGGNGKNAPSCSDGSGRKMPIFHGKCVVCTNAIVVGGIVVNNAFIKAGSIVTRDFG